MMQMSLCAYRNKVMGCWMGKNIGGTLGAPFECKRGAFDLDFYTQELGGSPLPNDDLDLQLVWLNVVEKYGRAVNAAILGEYWLSYVTPNWSEYGAGKNNLRAGLLPPLSGYVGNNNRDSCGAYIRTELWACLAPGHPEIAVRYAYEDAIVDHSREGVYGAVFFAALQSAAFVEGDRDRLIDIGLSYIPADCGIARGVACARACMAEGLDWKAARKRILQTVPGSFGMLGGYEDRTPEADVPVGPMGYDAPSNIALTIMAWLCGKDDFGRSLCIAAGCGEDADCIAGTLGATLGIVHGYDHIPEKWIAPMGMDIKTISINLGDAGIRTPKTVDELTERVLRLTPIFLGSALCDTLHGADGYTLSLCAPDALRHTPHRINSYAVDDFAVQLARQPFATYHPFTLFDVTLDYGQAPYIQEGVPFTLRLQVENNMRIQQWLTLRFHLPEGFSITPGLETSLQLEQYHGNIGRTQAEYTITPTGLTQARYDLVLELRSNGRHSKGLVPITLLTGHA